MNYQFKENGLETTITCPLDHVTVLKTGSFKNKFYKYKKDPTIELCTTCSINEKQNKEIQEIQNRIGHKITKIEKSGNVEYTCGNCESSQKSDLRNLRNKKRTKFCPKCQNDKNKTDLDEIRNILKEHGFTLLDYQNNKQVQVKCTIDHETTISMSGLKRGRGCPLCSSDRRKKTCLGKYGHTNVVGSKHGINKAKETCMKKHGVDHHRKVPEIQKKAEATVLEKYGVKWVFTKDEVYDKIRETHKLNHGVEFPLQSKEILNKTLLSSGRLKEIEIEGEMYKNILGYEDYALLKINSERINKLKGVHYGFDEEIPKFVYNTFDGKEHYYLPDIYIKDEKKIIEVKSPKTYEVDINIELKKKVY